VIGDSSGHRRRNPEGLMNSAEVVKREPEHDSRAVILELAAETIR
jgi:hypothetical protein